MTVYNFSAGPAVLPAEVLRQVQAELLDWHGSGMSVMEMSHRGAEFTEIAAAAEADFRELTGVSDEYAVLFMQGGGRTQFAAVPMNLSAAGAKLDYVDSGTWSAGAIEEAKRYGDVHVVASSRAANYTYMPEESGWQVRPDAAYLHVCTNETIVGVEYFPQRQYAVPLVVDTSSHILSRPIDFSRYALSYAGAQKNIGPAGLTIVVVRRDLLGKARPETPSMLDYQVLDDNGSMYNTPPTWAIYVSGLVFKWIKALGGVTAIEERNRTKAALLYDALDASKLFKNAVKVEHRSRMNIPFSTGNADLDTAFIKFAKDRGLVQLKGHKLVGGMRASLYNAMPIEGVQALVAALHEFEQQHR